MKPPRTTIPHRTFVPPVEREYRWLGSLSCFLAIAPPPTLVLLHFTINSFDRRWLNAAQLNVLAETAPVLCLLGFLFALIAFLGKARDTGLIGMLLNLCAVIITPALISA